MRRNRSLQVARLEADKADGRISQSYAAILPGASLGGGYTLYHSQAQNYNQVYLNLGYRF